MRSKEVEEAIKIVLAVRGTYDSYNDMMFGTGYADKEVQGAIDTVLNYISELANDNVEMEIKIQTEYISKDKIRDKIKELEEEKEKYVGYKGLEFSRTGVINSQIEVLKSIIGE